MLPLTIGDNIAHDRYLIVPIALLALCLALCLHGGVKYGYWPRYVGAAWILLATFCTVQTIPHWNNNLSLWAWAYGMHPQSQIASGNYLHALLESQQHAEALVLADTLLRDAVPMPVEAGLRHSRALALARMGRLAEAEHEIKLRLDLPRRDDNAGRYALSEALNLLAHIQLQQQRLAAAESNLRTAITLTPYLPRPHYNLARVLYARGHFAEAEAELAIAMRYATPEMAEAFRNAIADVRVRL